jgi:hypothetical protein
MLRSRNRFFAQHVGEWLFRVPGQAHTRASPSFLPQVRGPVDPASPPDLARAWSLESEEAQRGEARGEKGARIGLARLAVGPAPSRVTPHLPTPHHARRSMFGTLELSLALLCCGSEWRTEGRGAEKAPS